jgi:photosystem II stability/assembly factor-like uncharacterized protein
VTQIVFDTQDPNLVWAGVEIDGAWRSRDAGKTWTRTSEGLEHDDVHGLAVIHNGGRRLFATTAGGLHLSRDAGSTWTVQPVDSPWQYVRSVVPKTDGSGTIFLTNGNGPPGSDGRLFRSRDFGKTWQQAALPGRVESSAYFLAAHPADPNLLFLAATLGQLYRSIDGGDNWTACRAGSGKCAVSLGCRDDRRFGRARSRKASGGEGARCLPAAVSEPLLVVARYS